MKKIPLTGKYGKERFTLVDDDMFNFLMQWKWFAKKNKNTFYAARGLYFPGKKGVRKQKTLFMHNVIMNPPEGKFVDHINNVGENAGLNNQRSNMRIVTHTQNQWNRRKQRNTITPYKGVSLHKRTGRWEAQIRMNNKNIYLGVFLIAEDAGIAYNHAVKKYRPEYAYFNDIPNWENITPIRCDRASTLGLRNRSGYVGVSYLKSERKWLASITVNHKAIYLGSFKTLPEAVKAREEAFIKYYGEIRPVLLKRKTKRKTQVL